MIDQLFGMKVVTNKFATTQEQIKKHRKKRINKKWKKKYGMKEVPCMYMVAGNMVVHPDILPKMRARMAL